MDKEDLKTIRTELASVIEDNVNPQFEELGEDIGNLKEDVKGIKEDLQGVKNQMVTKAYLDEKLADLSGETIVRLKKEDAKVNRLIEMIGGKKILDEKEIKELEEIKVFPRPAA